MDAELPKAPVGRPATGWDGAIALIGFMLVAVAQAGVAPHGGVQLLDQRVDAGGLELNDLRVDRRVGEFVGGLDRKSVV